MKRWCYHIIAKNKEEGTDEKTNAWYDDFIIEKRKRNDTIRISWKMRVTDKAVSKWERDLSFPDINSIPKLAEIFEVSVDDLM